jgi:hypothetical protein
MEQNSPNVILDNPVAKKKKKKKKKKLKNKKKN